MLVASVLVDGVKVQEVDFDVVNFMEQVVIPDITIDGKHVLDHFLWNGIVCC